jgi:hypothetical protein
MNETIVVNQTVNQIEVIENISTLELVTPGPQGPIGLQGTQGTQGRQGTLGAQGVIGTQGNQGVLGLQGNQGTQGVLGLQGNQGVLGLQGNQGTQGVLGLQGNQGTQGVLGLQGSQGVQGLIGDDGFVAQSGPPENTSLLWLDTDEPEAVRPYSTRLFLSNSTPVEFDRGSKTGISFATYEISLIQSTGVYQYFTQINYRPGIAFPAAAIQQLFGGSGAVGTLNISFDFSDNNIWIAKVSVSNASTSNAVVIITRNVYANEIF